MSPLDPAGQLAALMRSQLASLRRRQFTKQPAARAASGSAVEPDFAHLLAQRLKAINPDDPRRARQAVRIYLESVLLAEFGPDLMRDPLFALMVDDVHEQMNSDPQLAGALAEAAAVLLSGKA